MVVCAACLTESPDGSRFCPACGHALAGPVQAPHAVEAQSAARINHPNIAVVHDVVEHENRPFLVMEYVEGESLAAVLRRERPAVEKILSMGR